MRQLLGVVLLLNGLAIALAAVTGNLPTYPPSESCCIHIPDQAGSPIFHIAGATEPSGGGVISIWNDI